MTTLIVIVVLALLYVAWRIATAEKKPTPADTQPVEPAPAPPSFTPLADLLKSEKFEDKDALKAPPSNPLPPERKLPHVSRKRKGKKS